MRKIIILSMLMIIGGTACLPYTKQRAAILNDTNILCRELRDKIDGKTFEAIAGIFDSIPTKISIETEASNYVGAWSNSWANPAVQHYRVTWIAYGEDRGVVELTLKFPVSYTGEGEYEIGNTGVKAPLYWKPELKAIYYSPLLSIVSCKPFVPSEKQMQEIKDEPTRILNEGLRRAKESGEGLRGLNKKIKEEEK